MVAAKPFVAAALAGLVFTTAAFADAPTVKISHADQAKATGALLHQSDVGAGWKGGTVKPSPLSPPNCPGFDPKESDLVVTGHADARFTFAGGVELDQDVQILATTDDVQTDFRRTISPGLAACLQFQLEKLTNVDHAVVAKQNAPPMGTVSAVYRAYIDVHSGKAHGRLLSDYVFFGEGRVEYEFTIIAPVEAADQLGLFELRLAQKVLARAGVEPA